jgi:hypothetical protein
MICASCPIHRLAQHSPWLFDPKNGRFTIPHQPDTAFDLNYMGIHFKKPLALWIPLRFDTRQEYIPNQKYYLNDVFSIDSIIAMQRRFEQEFPRLGQERRYQNRVNLKFEYIPINPDFGKTIDDFEFNRPMTLEGF